MIFVNLAQIIDPDTETQGGINQARLILQGPADQSPELSAVLSLDAEVIDDSDDDRCITRQYTEFDVSDLNRIAEGVFLVIVEKILRSLVNILRRIDGLEQTVVPVTKNIRVHDRYDIGFTFVKVEFLDQPSFSLHSRVEFGSRGCFQYTDTGDDDPAFLDEVGLSLKN